MVRLRPGSRSRRPRRAGRSEGYNLVVLAMAITVLNIMIAAALPAWSHIMQREREEELIFRGLQYAEAIRVFQQRFNRLPVRLEELIETEPRCIRQLWLNPMTEDGGWLLLQPHQPAAPANRPNPLRGGARGRAGRDPRDPRGRGQDNRVIVVPGEQNRRFTNAPFIGVASPEGGDAIKTFMNSRSIEEWQFRFDLLIGAQATQATAPQVMPTPKNAGNFWKPFPPGVTLPQQQQPGGVRPGVPGRPDGRRPGVGVPGAPGGQRGQIQPRGPQPRDPKRPN